MELALKAIAEPRRQEILRLVWSQERPAGDIARHFEISRPAVSKHLRVLREAGLVDGRGHPRPRRLRNTGAAGAQRGPRRDPRRQLRRVGPLPSTAHRRGRGGRSRTRSMGKDNPIDEAREERRWTPNATTPNAT